MAQETRYFKDENTGLTVRIDETADAGGVKLSCQIVNQLEVRDGVVYALPFDAPKSEATKEREERELALFGFILPSRPL